MSDKLAVLRLYKCLIKEAQGFKSYYYKQYFVRKIRNEFRKNKDANGETSTQLMKKAEDALAMLRRQTSICNSYHESKLVIE